VTTPGDNGRFDGYDVLAQTPHWDGVTADVVLRRLRPAPPLQWFTAPEAAVARALLDRLLGQDRTDAPYIDVLTNIDDRLARGATDGWHYADLPPDPAAWQQTLHQLDRDSHDRHGLGFAEASHAQQLALIQAVQDLDGQQWHGLPAGHVWSLWTRYACAAFYAHPWAWNEIGFGGPAYPRGYKNIGPDRREPWERPERDAQDPVPWAERAEAARRAHLDRFGR
jgi:hypothetical protein